jgi:starch-binding outer membrane protein, SusD/RagB family
MIKIRSILVLTVGMLFLLSCRKTYESLPYEQLTDDYIWDTHDSNATYASQYLSTVYAMLPVTYNRIGADFLDAASDDAVSSQTSKSNVEIMATGGITIFSNPDDSWANDYAGIRRATIFLNNFGIVPLKDRSEKRSWFGEARVMRAYFYWELVSRYGGIPLLGDSVRYLKDNVDVPRSSFDKCIQYIVSECNRAIDSLRTDPVSDIQQGRWTKAGAMALKARVLLYAASPLYNGGNVGGEFTGYASVDANRWKLAADAAKNVIDLHLYTLEPVFQNIFISQKSPEVIFAHLKGLSTAVENANGPPGYSAAPGQGNTSPTQELIDAFGMINGKPITDPASGYDAANPYANRDPRFAATILFNSAPWLSTSVETFNGGVSKPGGTLTQTKTGYYLRKFMGDFVNKTNYSNQYHDYIFLRYAEVLLNFAEARNEFSGPDADVYTAVEAIRQRAGLTPYTLDAGLTKEAMRDIIRNERRKELAFEEHRYRDIRRWKIAAGIYNKPLHGINIIRSNNGSFTYSATNVLTTKFEAAKMYFYPIPYNEVVSNKSMVQNPGW